MIIDDMEQVKMKHNANNKNYSKKGQIVEDYLLQLKKQVKQIDQLILEIDSRLKASSNLEGKKICTTNRKNGYQYYEVNTDKARKYIPKEKIAFAKAVAQRDYDLSVRRALVDARYKIMRFVKSYDTASIVEVYENLCDARKILVDPIIQTDEEFIKEWKRINCGQKNDYPMTKSYLTEQGEKVRSKSEKMLADLLLKHRIIYTYEPKVILKNGKIFYPDFAALNIRMRRTIYWEHFGLVSNGEYASNALYKLREYEDNGLEVGKDVLFSTESESQPFDPKKIEEKIENYLL